MANHPSLINSIKWVLTHKGEPRNEVTIAILLFDYYSIIPISKKIVAKCNVIIRGCAKTDMEGITKASVSEKKLPSGLYNTQRRSSLAQPKIPFYNVARESMGNGYRHTNESATTKRLTSGFRHIHTCHHHVPTDGCLPRPNLMLLTDSVIKRLWVSRKRV